MDSGRGVRARDSGLKVGEEVGTSARAVNEVLKDVDLEVEAQACESIEVMSEGGGCVRGDR